MSQYQILNTEQAKNKIYRIALEIVEQNTAVHQLVLLGVNSRGYLLAKELEEHLTQLNKKIMLINLQLIDNKISANVDLEILKSANIILVDDVLNSGYTLAQAFAYCWQYNPQKIEVAVLVNRDHLNFPIKANYTGLSLATTLQENVVVNFNEKSIEAFLE